MYDDNLPPSPITRPSARVLLDMAVDQARQDENRDGVADATDLALASIAESLIRMNERMELMFRVMQRMQ